MKKILLAVMTIIAIGISTQSYSQSKFTVNFTGGYSAPMADFKNNIILSDTAQDNWPYRMKNGFNFGAQGKLSLGNTGNYKLAFGLNYSSFSNEGTVTGTDGIARTFKPKVSLITIALGGEYDFLPKGNVNPYLGLDVTGNFWGGSFKFTPNNTTAFRDQDMKSEARFGLQFNGGCEFKLSKNVGLTAGLKYNIANLVGKGQDDPSEVGPNEVDLGDKAHDIFPDRTVAYLQTYAGLVIYFGFPKSTK